MRTSVKRTLGVGIVSGVAYAAWRAWNARVPKRPPGVEWSSAPFPFPPIPRDGAGAGAGAGAAVPPAPISVAAWVEPDADGECPPTHAIKAKMTSGIYHAPGGANYARTKPDRCYADAAAAEADGLRPSKV